MKDKDGQKAYDPLKKSSQEKKNEFVDFPIYFENANRRNRDAFCELLDYTVENRSDPRK